VVVGARPQLHFLDFGLMLVLACFALLLLLLVAMFAPVHDLDDRGAGSGSDLYKVEFGFSGSFPRFIQ